jgi:hypothetical protein
MTKQKAATMSKSALPLLVLGFDPQGQPRAAKVSAVPRDVSKLVKKLGFRSYSITSRDVADVARRLPSAQLDGEGYDVVPAVRQELYSELVAALVADPKQSIAGPDREAKLPKPKGYPASFVDIQPGHLILAEEGVGYGWWEAIVLEHRNDHYWLRYRDYPQLPQFARDRRAIALLAPNK